MRGYFTVSGILLILLIIDFAVAAPAPVQQKRRAGIDVSVVRLPEDPDALTMLEKRGDDWSDLWVDYLRSDVKLSKVTKPKSSTSVTRPPPPSGPARGQTNKQPPPPSSTDERLPDEKLPLLDILIS